jgi:hypothetical protein
VTAAGAQGAPAALPAPAHHQRPLVALGVSSLTIIVNRCLMLELVFVNALAKLCVVQTTPKARSTACTHGMDVAATWGGPSELLLHRAVSVSALIRAS